MFTSRPAWLRGGVAVALWVVIASVMVFFGLFAISSLVNASATQVLSNDEVNGLLAAESAEASGSPGAAGVPGSTGTSGSPGPTSAPTETPTETTPTEPANNPASSPPPPAATSSGYSSPGGNLIGQCLDGAPTILSATPAQGFEIDNDVDVDHGIAEVDFSSDSVEYKVNLDCATGEPVWAVDEWESH